MVITSLPDILNFLLLAFPLLLYRLLLDRTIKKL